MPLFGIQFPWETEEGEGFIAPWTPVVETPSGFIQSGTELSDRQVAQVEEHGDQWAPLVPRTNGMVTTLPYLTPPAPSMRDYAYEPTEPSPQPAFIPSIAPVYRPSPAPAAPAPLVIPTALNGRTTPVATAFPGSQPTHGDVVPGLLGTIVNGVPISGPGVPEPPRQMVAKEWHWQVESKKYGAFFMFYWKLIDGRMMSYHSPTKTWKIWRPVKHIVISPNPRVKTLTKLNRLNKRVERMLKPYQPKPKKAYGQLPARLLSAAEKKLIS